MLVLITDTGRVEQRVVDVPVIADEDLVSDLRARLNAAMDGKRLGEADAAVAQLGDLLPKPAHPSDATAITAVLSALRQMIDDSSDQRVVMAGAANLARGGHDFSNSLGLVLEALEEQVVLMRLLNEANSPDISVRIGHENNLESLAGTSVVASGYGQHEVIARLGVIGPTRMDYPGTMGAVRAVARYVGVILADEK
jgi:heat-inducible transcriptional repressor